MKFDRALVTAFILLGLCLTVGNWLSLRKPLWNDEIYTQERVIEALGYSQIFSGSLPEGNNSPLFYLIQKSFFDLNGFHFSLQWNKEWFLHDPRSQVLLRFPANLFMSLTLAAIFYYFARNYSLVSGWYGFLLGVSSSMVWIYWVEARPYPLWVFLTTLQALIFLTMLREKEGMKRHWANLTVVHWLLSLTAVVSLVQIFLISLILFLLKFRDWKKIFLMTFLPSAICLYYFLKAPIVGYGVISFKPLIFANVPPERLAIIFLYGLLCLWILKSRQGDPGRYAFRREAGGFLAFFLFMLAGCFLQLWIIHFKASGGWAHVQVPDRVFIQLMPLGVIGSVLFSVDLFQYFQKNLWARINLLIMFGGLLISQCLKTLTVLNELNLY